MRCCIDARFLEATKNAPSDSESTTLNEESIARLKNINVQLDALQMRIHEIAQTYRRQISQAATDLWLASDRYLH